MSNKLLSSLFVSTMALMIIAPTAQAKLVSTPNKDNIPNHKIENKLQENPGLVVLIKIFLRYLV